MKSFIDNFLADTVRQEILILAVPFAFWFFCFFYFFNGQLHLQADAISYADHIPIFTDSLSKGIYPLWDPSWFNGAPNDFFLRRIGDVNPLFFIIIFLKWAGLSSATSYLIFLGLYYFLAGWGIYLIARLLFVDRFFAFTAYVLFLFSSWGSEVFYNYIVIIFVPIVWFFYFLLSFARSVQKGYFLGMLLCVGLTLTTYIPFLFLTILAIFLFLYVLFYGKEFIGFLKNSAAFFYKNKAFTGFCLVFLLMASVPGVIFYKESKSGEFVLPGRHSGADVSSAVAVGLENASSGDIVSHGYFDRLFDDHEDIDMGDIYLPYIFFLILLATVPARLNKLILFLLFNILGVSLITITSAAGVHRFLYEHVIIFKFIRQLYYFFWLSMLPMSILLGVAALRSLLTSIKDSSHQKAWAVYIAVAHLVFALFLFTRQGVMWGAWAAVAISLVYFSIYFYCDNKFSYKAGFVLFFLAIFIQSAQVYRAMDNKLFQMQREQAEVKENPGQSPKAAKLDLYFASNWFALLVDTIDPQVFEDYRHHLFILYDNVVPYVEDSAFFRVLEPSFKANNNVAFVSNAESQSSDWFSSAHATSTADLDPVFSGKLSVVYSDANTWKLRSRLDRSEFLVINDNYNPDWHAFINNRPVHLFRANVAFKGIWLPSGDSDILLRFSTPKRYLFHYGLILLFMGVFLYTLVLLKSIKRVDGVILRP